MKLKAGYGLIAAALILGGCGKTDAPPAQASTKTKAQKDSAIANSGLPGSEGVAKAMRAADSAKAHQAAIDSIKP
jgi:hypothetical protein